jgi:FkbM family methyltransferase
MIAPPGPLASVVISTHNRAEALAATLDALGEQDLSPTDYEVLVVDDGSSDTTWQLLTTASTPYRLRPARLPFNQGVSAGRNAALRVAEGRYVVMISDDLVVPREFLTTHIATLERFPHAWVVGGFRQLGSLTETPFGRFLDRLERGFDQLRLGRRLEPGLYEMTVPTARNLSMRRADLEAVGLFDERFRVTCEDQDLAQRAMECGISFIFNAGLECVHNDQTAELGRYVRFQRRGARDTARLCLKYPETHGRSPIATLNGYVRRSDGRRLILRKLVRRVLATRLVTAGVEVSVRSSERLPMPDRWRAWGYRAVIGLYTFKGFREGLRESRPDHGEVNGPSNNTSTALLKRLRAAPVVNATLTHAVRASMRTLGVQSELVVKHLPRVGTTTMILPRERRARLWSRGDDWVPNQVFWRGWDGYEPEMTPIFWRLATAARVTLDVGAHIGFYAILAAIANEHGSVFAFEPLPPVFERLQRNLALNGLENVIGLRKAAGAVDGRAPFFHVPGVIPCSSSLSESFMSSHPLLESLPVSVVRLDTFAAEHGVATVDLIKLDTETTEPDVLLGMGPLLRSSRPDIFCEVLQTADADALTTILEPLGYSFYLLTDAGPQRRSRVTAHQRWRNHLFTTRSNSAIAWLAGTVGGF